VELNEGIESRVNLFQGIDNLTLKKGSLRLMKNERFLINEVGVV